MKQDNNDYRTDNNMQFGDSSNYAKEGEGVPEMLQRRAREDKRGPSGLIKALPPVPAKITAKKLLKGEI